MILATVSVPALDTGLGREAGYRDDVELIAVAETHRAALAELLTPEALARLDAAEQKFADAILYGSVLLLVRWCLERESCRVIDDMRRLAHKLWESVSR